MSLNPSVPFLPIPPRAQYDALLIDEGHDFEADWLKLVVQMVDPETNSLLLLYDDAQSIYRKTSGLGFTLSSVGVQAKCRSATAFYATCRGAIPRLSRFYRPRTTTCRPIPTS